ncbi:MAG: ABC-F family ATP-binding cassette domain-containing protein [Firmicutes bacterium]|nr:ABC-F family ATP-binding cassette domain-containing protein [Bacillota bacterium]
MVLLNAEGITKSYTEKPLLKDIDISIHSDEKVGLIGVNGTGKTTLLKILAGVEEAEAGTITTARNLRMGYLPQNPDFDGEKTVIEQALSYISEAGGGTQEYECKTMLTKLGVDDFDAKMKELSGGQRKIVAMAALFARETDLLIMDEPTNHLDNNIIEWLEEYLISYKGAVLMITHDRYFLCRVTNRIVEIDKTKLYSYEGNYDLYLETKAAREEMILATERKRLAIYKKELAWIRRGARARTTKAKGRVERFHELENSKLVIDDSKLEMSVSSSRLGKKIIEIENISKAYEGRKIIEDFSYNLLRDDRVGIIGPNGCGKSTLLKIIMGQVEPDEGCVNSGTTVKVGYFSQDNEVLDPKKRIIKYAEEISDSVKTKDGTFSASQMLERFLFPTYMHSVEIGRLSGGEKRRLYLLSILMSAPNVLILDEPTNDLDIDTLTVLEDYLDDFPGAVIIVSHDRYFLDRLVVRTFAFEGEGRIGHYPGGYSDYAEKRKNREKELKAEIKAKSKSERPEGSSNNEEKTAEDKPKKLRFSFKEQKEFETIEEDVFALEEKIAEIEAQMYENSQDYEKLRDLSEEKEVLEKELEYKMERWEYLSELNEKINEARNRG